MSYRVPSISASYIRVPGLNVLFKGSDQECCTFVGTISNLCYMPVLPVQTAKYLYYSFCSVFALAASLVVMGPISVLPLTYTKLVTD